MPGENETLPIPEEQQEEQAQPMVTVASEVVELAAQQLADAGAVEVTAEERRRLDQALHDQIVDVANQIYATNGTPPIRDTISRYGDWYRAPIDRVIINDFAEALDEEMPESEVAEAPQLALDVEIVPERPIRNIRFEVTRDPGTVRWSNIGESLWTSREPPRQVYHPGAWYNIDCAPKEPDKKGDPVPVLVFDQLHGCVVAAWRDCKWVPFSTACGEFVMPHGAEIELQMVTNWSPLPKDPIIKGQKKSLEEAYLEISQIR
jgi:hypothetical protein